MINRNHQQNYQQIITILPVGKQQTTTKNHKNGENFIQNRIIYQQQQLLQLKDPIKKQQAVQVAAQELNKSNNLFKLNQLKNNYQIEHRLKQLKQGPPTQDELLGLKKSIENLKKSGGLQRAVNQRAKIYHQQKISGNLIDFENFKGKEKLEVLNFSEKNFTVENQIDDDFYCDDEKITEIEKKIINTDQKIVFQSQGEWENTVKKNN
eukprot:TRINITY_DN45052_c0_g2_i1.p1 TRINITY_DN45052_c0_g2~~TRINITY_DN45052_c0_g2_i1.p1  ORF type:complete len:208 (-),score=47.56 TRINITY_DN45052_c0_g2_i1:76-699(-)